jgi:hypothetical protein
LGTGYLAMQQYVRVSAEEARRLPAVRPQRVLSACDATAATVLERSLAR